MAPNRQPTVSTLPQHTLLISHHLQLRMVAILHRKVAMASNK